MYIDGWTLTALVVFFGAAAAVLYRGLMNVCDKLYKCLQGQEQSASEECRS